MDDFQPGREAYKLEMNCCGMAYQISKILSLKRSSVLGTSRQRRSLMYCHVYTFSMIFMSGLLVGQGSNIRSSWSNRAISLGHGMEHCRAKRWGHFSDQISSWYLARDVVSKFWYNIRSWRSLIHSETSNAIGPNAAPHYHRDVIRWCLDMKVWIEGFIWSSLNSLIQFNSYIIQAFNYRVT